jgi:hypothetical protein
MAATTQLRLRFPDMTLPECGDWTDADFQDMVAAAVSQCPQVAALDSEPKRRFAVLYALSDRRGLRMEAAARIVGEASERTLFRWRLEPWCREACIQILDTLLPDNLKLLSLVLNEEAGELAQDLRFRRKSLGSLSDGDKQIIAMLTAGRASTLRITSPDGTTAEFETGDDLDRHLEASRARRSKLLGGADGGGDQGGELGGCQRVPAGERQAELGLGEQLGEQDGEEGIDGGEGEEPA